MPSLLNARICNARFNGGKQYYEDLRLSSHGDALVVDMVNGGGKSFLIQCIGQTIIPNSRWQNDWEFKAVFEAKNKNTVIHCCTEWELDSGMEYKYLLAGFCASKPTNSSNDEEKLYSDFDRFSYICLYNERNENDIFNLPLKDVDSSGNKKFMSLSELKRYLSSIKSSNYYTETFTSSKSYRKRLSQYNITEAEWELIKGVNADEKYVATYLRQYNNSEKFILDFMIPKIEECYSTRVGYEYQDSDKLATSLLNIRDKMDELMKSKSISQEYNKIIESVQKLAIKISDLSEKYADKEKLCIEIKKSILFLESEILKLTDKKESTEADLVQLKEAINQLDINIDSLEIRVIEKKYNDKISQENEKLGKLEEIKKNHDKESSNLKFKVQENTYHSIIEDENLINKHKSTIKSLELNNSELVSRRNSLAREVKSHLIAKKQMLDNEKEITLQNILECEMEIKKYSQSVINKKGEIAGIESANSRIKKEKEKISTKIDSKEFKAIQYIDKNIYSTRILEDTIEENEVLIEDLSKDILSVEQQIKEADEKTHSLELEKTKIESIYNQEAKNLKIAEASYKNCESLFDIYGCSSIEDLNNIISEKLHHTKELESNILANIHSCKEIISTLKNHKITLNKDTLTVLNLLKYRYSSALLGLDFISTLDIKEKEYFINMNSLIPYSILLDDNDYRKFIENKDILDNYYGSAIPVISKKTLKETIIYPNGISFTAKDIEFYTNEEKTAKLKEEKEKELNLLQNELYSLTEKLESYTSDIFVVKEFINKYVNKATLESMAANLKKTDELLYKCESNIEDYIKLKISFKSDLNVLNEKIKLTKEKAKEAKNNLVLLRSYLELQEKLNEFELELKDNEELLVELNKAADAEQQYINEIILRKAEFEEKSRSYYKKEITLESDINNLSFVSQINDIKLLDEDVYLEKNNTLLAIMDNLQGASSDLKMLTSEIKRCEERIKNNINIIRRENFELTDFSHITLDFVKNSEEILKDLSDYVKTLASEIEIINTEVNAIRVERGELKGSMNTKIDSLLEKKSIQYADIKATIDNLLNGASYVDKIKELKNTRKEKIQEKINFEKKIKELDTQISSNNTNKSKFMAIDKEDSVVVDEVKITNIRDYQEVSTDLKAIERGIMYKTSEVNKEIENGQKTVTNIHGYVEMLLDLENLPTSSSLLKEIEIKLVGESDESWVSMLKLEQDKIDENIKSLEIQEEKFVTLCVQKSENVLRDIKKLTELSRIEINGSKQEMLRINLNKLPDELAREKMKNYIEGVIASCSEEEDDALRKKKISTGLRTDNLFKQIIDRITNKSVELYKLEDVENMEINEWLSLDRAYGSKGQTNGMYISMLICIISYLRKLYTNSTDESKKVIILDNPFSGTTSEIIWVPILNLLKENNVQLWAVGYEIKTQLANIFPTRYYLGKKASKQYESIVVNRFHSYYNTNLLGYDTLKGNKIDIAQISMDIDS